MPHGVILNRELQSLLLFLLDGGKSWKEFLIVKICNIIRPGIRLFPPLNVVKDLLTGTISPPSLPGFLPLKMYLGRFFLVKKWSFCLTDIFSMISWYLVNIILHNLSLTFVSVKTCEKIYYNIMHLNKKWQSRIRSVISSSSIISTAKINTLCLVTPRCATIIHISIFYSMHHIAALISFKKY